MGTSTVEISHHITRKDHPHACGDKIRQKTCVRHCKGSSPRVWGQVDNLFILHNRGRIIPTRVGTSLCILLCSRILGIIPTRVGTRSPMLSVILCSRDHPHACGDKWLSKYGKNMDWGSSPRVWGQAYPTSLISPAAGIIPTRVGTRGISVTSRCICWDHPHACGDKAVLGIFTADAQGSSPRVWGQECEHTVVCLCLRIIPTRVGTSADKTLAPCHAGDHPHACGDKITSCLLCDMR